jgi:hypothetical protein
LAAYWMAAWAYWREEAYTMWYEILAMVVMLIA